MWHSAIFFNLLNYYFWQTIGALDGLTSALEKDVKAGLRTDSRRCGVCSPTFLKFDAFADSRTWVWGRRVIFQGCNAGKHRRHRRQRDGALELHIRTARGQIVRETWVVSPRFHLYVSFALLPPSSAIDAHCA